MALFVVNSCDMNGCLYWRMGDNCAKDGMCIQTTIELYTQLHDAHNCQIRQQMNEYRLEHALES